MHKIYYKLAAGTGAAVLAYALMAGSAMASDIEIKDNGAFSTNSVVVQSTQTSEVIQGSETNVWAAVSASASTGGNSASFNTGGDTTIRSGNATATATMTVTGGSNTATNPCGCPDPTLLLGDGGVVISDNGAFSHNWVRRTSVSSSSVVQGASTHVGAYVGAKAKTGKNKAWFNTGGTTNVTSGSASSSSSLTVTGGSNTTN